MTDRESKNALSLFALLLSLFSMALFASPAAAAYLVSVKGTVNALKKPATNAPAYGVFKTGDKLVVIENFKNPQGNWMLVRSDAGLTGWVESKSTILIGNFNPGKTKKYANARYSFSVSVPNSMTINEESQNGDGTTIDGKNISVTVWGGNYLDETKSFLMMESQMKEFKGTTWNLAVKGASASSDWYIISGVSKKKNILWQKGVFSPADESYSVLQIIYPVSAKAAASKAVNTLLSSFTMAASSPDTVRKYPKSIREYSEADVIKLVKKSRYYKNGKTFGEVFSRFFEKSECIE